MDTLDTTYISYGGNYLAIQLETPELHGDVTRIFEKLLVHDPPSVFHTLRVKKTDHGYYIDGANEMEPNADTHRSVLQHLKFEIIHQFITLTPNHLWLHAAAASINNKGIMLSGAWGKGKSTIVSELCNRGALYLSDDIVPINMDSGLLMPFHLTPMRREYEDAHAQLSPEEVSNLPKHTIPIKSESYAREGVMLSAVVFPEYTPDANTALEPCSPALATMTLLENCLNLKTKKAEAVHYLGQLIEHIPVYRLPYNNGEKGAQLIADLITG